jgi:hypothetical protein
VTVSPAPTISGIADSSITSNAATISWKTNVPTNGQVNYGPTTAYGFSSPVVDASPMTTAHTVVLSGLSPGTLYHYQVVSVGASGDRVVSGDNIFTTLTNVPRTPGITAASSAQPGAPLKVSVSGAPGNATDWVGLYRAGSVGPGQYLSWQYLNGTQTPPATGRTAATLTFTMPTAAGTYQFVLHGGDGFNPLAATAPVTVGKP